MSDGLKLHLERYERIIENSSVIRDVGKVIEVTGVLIRGYVPGATLGSVCEIHSQAGNHTFLAEVVGFKERQVLMMALGEIQGVGLGSRIILLGTRATVPVGEGFLGRVINALGEPIDGKEKIRVQDELPLYREGTNPLTRPPIREPLQLGVRAIDGLITVGQGQRVGVLAGSGVGKSVLMGMIARNTRADVNVIAMIGERGREVREFIEDVLGEEGLKRSVVIAVTSDQSALLRMRGAFLASTMAEYFCGTGANVLLMMDSVTRFAMAQREIGLAVGEPPSTKGYTPSVFSLLPKLLERAGNYEGRGSITGLYTVLVEGDDPDDPIGDAVRSIVDGHIVLDRSLAHKGHFPAIDVLRSTSRVMRNVATKEHVRSAQFLRENMAIYKEAEDLINIGAYKKGANPKVDQAVSNIDHINTFLTQGIEEKASFESTETAMGAISGGGR